MSSAQNKPHQSAKSASPPEPKADAQTPPVAQPPSSESHMDQSLDSPLTETPPAPSISSEVMSSTETTDTTPSLSPAPIPPKPPQPEATKQPAAVPPTPASAPKAPEPSTTAGTVDKAKASQENALEAGQAHHEAQSTDDAASQAKDALSRQQPIPPASEPMQYRAIGLVRGKYVASEEQFTRGIVETDDGVTLGAVLLGRVMSLVKKHLDLEQPHLWVVYPRTREKGDADLHVQIVGVWEPEKLSRIDGESNLDEEEAPESGEDDGQDEASVSSVEGMSLVPATDLDDKYFSVRGEVVYQSIEENRLLVKIRRAPRPGSDESKAFKVALNGTLEGKAVGYFWDLNVQRQGIDLVVQDGTMIGAVPPQKRSKKSFRDGDRPYRRGGPGGRPGGGRPGGGRPGGRPGAGGSRPRWNNAPRDGQPRPSRGDRPNPPSPNRPPTSKPVIKRRTQENSEEG